MGFRVRGISSGRLLGSKDSEFILGPYEDKQSADGIAEMAVDEYGASQVMVEEVEEKPQQTTMFGIEDEPLENEE